VALATSSGGPACMKSGRRRRRPVSRAWRTARGWRSRSFPLSSLDHDGVGTAFDKGRKTGAVSPVLAARCSAVVSTYKPGPDSRAS